MINTFIAALVALFFWGKSSKDVEEKTQFASWTRTIVYGVLMCVILVFYIKTYQVATVIHSIEMKGIRSSVDSTGHIVDTIAAINIRNFFHQM